MRLNRQDREQSATLLQFELQNTNIAIQLNLLQYTTNHFCRS